MAEADRGCEARDGVAALTTDLLVSADCSSSELATLSIMRYTHLVNIVTP